MEPAPPILHVIAGPNGAGKSSLYNATIKRLTAAEFVNPDILAMERLGAHALTQREAELGQQLADERRAALMRAGESLVTESTFSHHSKLDLVQSAIDRGYRVVVYHVSVDSPDLAVARVQARRENGGHPVAEDRIRGRYERNGEIIRQAVLMADYAFVFDNSMLGRPPRRLMTFANGRVSHLADHLPAWAQEIYRADLAGSPAAAE